MKLPATAEEYIQRDNLIWLLSAQGVSIVPFFFYLPIWLCFFWMAGLVWRVQILRMKWPFPNNIGKLCLGLSCVVVVYTSFNGGGSVEPMVAFLVCSFVLKIVEMRTKKDAVLVLFISFIAIGCQFLFAQGVIAAMYGFISLFILLSAWQAALYSRAISLAVHLKSGGILVLQGLPFLIVIFIIMPRLGPLWSVPVLQKQGRTGFSESLTLGDVGKLVRSPEVAFRVSFEGEKPELRQLYWRGLILDYYDGYKWRAKSYQVKKNINSLEQWQRQQRREKSDGGEKFKGQESGIDTEEEIYKYSIVLEPHSYRWLFSLNKPVALDSAQMHVFTNEYSVLAARKPIYSKSKYTVISRIPKPMFVVGQSNRIESRNNSKGIINTQAKQSLLLPPSTNPRARVLAKKWRTKHSDDSEIIHEALKFYHGEFSYTLQPTPLGIHPVDQFLFDSKNGFCEHFASSFVFLMRSAGIPARVVLGYQGGSFNGAGSYFIVRQSDAHAWAEVWLNGAWQTVDPTTAVSPERITIGIEQSLSNEDLEFVAFNKWQLALIGQLFQRWDAVGYSWNRWVLNYDSKTQAGLLTKLLGNTSPWRVGSAFIGICSVIFIFWLYLLHRGKQPKYLSPENVLLKPVLTKLSRKGWVIQPGESLDAFVKRIQNDDPDLARPLARILKPYTMAAYGGGCQKEALQMLRVAIKG